MKRTIHASQQLDKYIEQEKQKGKSPSTVVNELFDEYVKLKTKQIIAKSSSQQVATLFVMHLRGIRGTINNGVSCGNSSCSSRGHDYYSF